MRSGVRVGAGYRTGGQVSVAPYIKGAMASLPAEDGCPYPATCALCKWRRLGDLLRPLTTAEWATVFREPAG